jgi:hypothetical protein
MSPWYASRPLITFGRSFAILWLRDADSARLEDGRTLDETLLDLQREDVLTALMKLFS